MLRVIIVTGHVPLILQDSVIATTVMMTPPRQADDINATRHQAKLARITRSCSRSYTRATVTS